MNKLDLNTPPEHQPRIPESMMDNQTPVDEPSTVMHNQDSATPMAITNANEMAANTSSNTPGKPMKKQSSKLVILFGLVAVIAGVATGFGVFQLNTQSGSGSAGSNSAQGGGEIQQIAGDTVNAGDVFGIQDEETFKDSAEGYLIDGGIGDEGSHQLLRAGGDSQTVVLTSSVTDLDKLVGMEVKIWGETFKAQKAGWLMDVGRVEVINPDAEEPSSQE